MIASAARGAALALALTACAGSGPPAPMAPLEPLTPRPAPLPDAVDHAAHDLAAAALRPGAPDLDARLARLEALERERRARGEAPSGVPPLARHLRNATLPTRAAVRAATRALLDEPGLDPALRAGLEEELRDDPLELAEKRLTDARRSRFARLFNTIAAPLGRSLTSLPLAPIRFTRALLSLLVLERTAEPIDVAERQALAHWKAFLDAHPEEASPEVLERVQALQARWTAMKRERALDAAERALEHGEPALGFVLAERALGYAPEDGAATRLRDRARREALARRAALGRTLEARGDDLPEVSDPGARPLALALVQPDADLKAAAAAYLARAPEGPLATVARLAQATARSEAGDPEGARRSLERLARAGAEGMPDPMARHARALVESPAENPYRAFRAARRADRAARGGWLLLGARAAGPRDLDLPDPLEWMIEAPTFLESLAGLPNRLIRLPWLPPTATPAAVHARRYLAREPGGVHAAEVRRWLVDFEAGRGNAIEAHRIAVEDPGGAVPAGRTAELAEEAARQALESALRQERPDLRLGLLQHTTRTYPDTEAGREAGRRAREEVRAASAQRIRVSRGFLEEHPEVAARDGLGLAPALLDGERDNGELHPDGVTLLGGQVLEISLVDGGADPDDPPRRVRRRISAERLARSVALLDEAARRAARVDPDVPVEPDADRDLYFERARLGVAASADPRPTARSTYTYLGARERYGMVRKRESILPVELVLQGSFDDLGLGAFPRMRLPKPTPDAILYR